jgi:hypothetical protein
LATRRKTKVVKGVICDFCGESVTEDMILHLEKDRDALWENLSQEDRNKLLLRSFLNQIRVRNVLEESTSNVTHVL